MRCLALNNAQASCVSSTWVKDAVSPTKRRPFVALTAHIRSLRSRTVLVECAENFVKYRC
jgi:hypothetical protein